MKKKFKCYRCGKVNEFETDKALVELREAAEVSPGRTYVVECKSCGAENRVTVKENAE
jgi:predicted nucleic-acid-binding Zn-ribbon protein